MNSSDSFLKKIASKCFQSFGEQSDSLTIIFPNKRAGLFFRKYLAEFTNKPIWSPIILSIEEFVVSLSSVKPTDQNRLLFALYTIYKSKIKNAESLDNFYQWGEMILNDFNDIDNYLIDPEHIFRIVKSQKELDEAFYYLPEEDQKTIQSFWASFLPEPTKSQNDFLKTWEILNELYKEFNELLDAKEISYKGKIYRNVAESIDDIKLEYPDKTYWFAGFNALTKVEEKIIKHFIREMNADIFWDVDSYYFDDAIQEAGYFFRQYANDSVFGESIKRDRESMIGEKTQNITNYSVALSAGQVKAVGEKLSQLSAQEGFLPEKTVVVLPDEGLLLPVLNSIPNSIDQVNVTMGYPLKNSNFFSFMEMLLELINTQPKATEGQYFKSRLIVSLITHPVYESFFQQSGSDLVAQTLDQNISFVRSDQLQESVPRLYDLIESKESVPSLLSKLKDLLVEIDKKELTIIDQAVIYELHELIKNIQKSTEEFDLQIDLKSLHRLFKRLGNTKVPFSGEPLSGLQIMGILETRNLDFDHVFILDMNEGIWPKDSSNGSFIPYNIRKAFDLPVVEHQDAIQSYLFYRLLHHSNTIDIYHNNVSEFNHSGELSRYVMQIQMESSLKIEQRLISNTISPKSIKPIAIHKTENVLKVLRNYYSENDVSRLSPSAINTFLDCKLKFYFKYIEKIKEKKELQEALDPAAFGNLLHHTMEFFYDELINRKGNKIIELYDLESSFEVLQTAIKKAFETENRDLNDDTNHNGQQLIASKVILKLAQQIINYDKEYTPFHVHALEAGGEDGYVLDLPIDVDGNEIKIGLKGVIDRIDKKGNVVRILDYKSGGDERNFPSIESLFDREVNKRNKAAMQVLLYCLFYKQNSKDDSQERIIPGVFNSKDLFSPDFSTNIKHGRSNVIEDFSIVENEYTDQLKVMLTDMFDSTSVFDQTNDFKKCEYCPYAEICMRK